MRASDGVGRVERTPLLEARREDDPERAAGEGAGTDGTPRATRWRAVCGAALVGVGACVAVMSIDRGRVGGARALGGAQGGERGGGGRPTTATVAKIFSENEQGKVDRLAIAASLDPVRHAYLPDAFHGYDPKKSVREYAHPPAVSKSETGYTLCVDLPSQAWDSTYALGFGTLFKPGMCVETVLAGQNVCANASADVRVFSQSGYLWRGVHKGKHGEYLKPPKVSEKQVDFYFAHEAAGTFGGELRRQNVVEQFDYLGYFDRERSAFWWPFGPTLDSMTTSFPAYTIPHSERIPGVGWIAIDCLPPRPQILWEISQRFPVFSMGSCANNAAQPRNLPGRGADNLDYQRKMAKLMFYFAMENAAMCEGYSTEKVWLALQRGSIPIYAATDAVYELMPTKNSFIDLRQYPNPDALAAELRSIATNETRYREYTDWRYQDPKTWSPGFRRLLRVTSSDMKAGLCAVLQKGDKVYPRAQIQGRCIGAKTRILGRLGGEGFRAVLGGPQQRLRNAIDFLDEVRCDDKTLIAADLGKEPEEKGADAAATAATTAAAEVAAARQPRPRGDACYRLKRNAAALARPT